jgi:hypothetical protein
MLLLQITRAGNRTSSPEAQVEARKVVQFTRVGGGGFGSVEFGLQHWSAVHMLLLQITRAGNRTSSPEAQLEARKVVQFTRVDGGFGLVHFAVQHCAASAERESRSARMLATLFTDCHMRSRIGGDTSKRASSVHKEAKQ